MKTSSRPASMRGLRVFCAAARRESFRLAADELFITPSAVSHQVKKLEAELQVHLFQRNGRSIHLTPAGQLLFDEAAPRIQQIDEIISGLRGDSPMSSLRVSVQPFFANELFVPRLSDFTARHPNIDIHIESSDEKAARHPGSADVSIRLFRHPPPGLAAERLFALRLVPACSKAFRDKLNVVGWHVASEVPIVTHSGRPNAWKSWSDHSGVRVPKSAHLVQLDTMTAVARAAEQGVGAALVPLPLADALFESGRLVRLFDYELYTRDSYYIVCEHEQMARPEVQALRAWTLQTFANYR